MIIDFLRSFRIGPFAIFDFAASYLVVYFLAPYLSKIFHLIGIEINREQWLWLTLPIATLTHIIFRTETAFTKMIMDPTGGVFAKIVLIFMISMVYFRRNKANHVNSKY